MGIGKSQAKAIAEGFLDEIGSGSVDDLQPRDTLSEMLVIAGEFIEDAQSNLNASNTIASGELNDSLILSDPKIDGSNFYVDVNMLFYGRFVNKGVKGTKEGSGLYVFKNEYPSSGMVEAIRKWLKQGKLKTANTNARKSPYKSEIKNASIGAIDNAYAVARSIKQHGIKPTGFLDKAIISTQSRIKDRLGLSLKVDILTSLKRNGYNDSDSTANA